MQRLVAHNWRMKMGSRLDLDDLADGHESARAELDALRKAQNEMKA